MLECTGAGWREGLAQKKIVVYDVTILDRQLGILEDEHDVSVITDFRVWIFFVYRVLSRVIVKNVGVRFAEVSHSDRHPAVADAARMD